MTSRTRSFCRTGCGSPRGAGRFPTSFRNAFASSRAAWRNTTSPARTPSSASSEARGTAHAALDRLDLRIERLQLTFRFTYAFHARELRFERDTGEGFVRIFPETFSFHPERHDPAEIYLQFDDLFRKPKLISPRASRRDANVLISRLMLGIPRYLEGVLARLEREGRLEGPALARVYEDIALLAQILLRFLASSPSGRCWHWSGDGWSPSIWTPS
jgi:hypothetical protein